MTVRTLPVVDMEPWLSRQELADALGVSVTTIDRQVRADMPSMLIGRVRKFRLSRVGCGGGVGAHGWREARARVVRPHGYGFGVGSCGARV